MAALANELAPAHRVTVVCLSDEPPFYRLDPNVKLLPVSPHARMSGRLSEKLLVMLQLRRVVREVSPSLICIFGESISAATLIATVFVRAKKFVFDRASPLAVGSWRRKWLSPVAYQFADGVIVQTERARVVAHRRYFGRAVHVLPNPVRRPDYIPAMGQRDRVVVSVGYLGGKKNQEFLIRCFLTLSEASEWRLVLVGDGPERQRLEALSAELGGQERVLFLGQSAAVEKHLLWAQVFAFASLSEGFPNALAEALACGCACIAFDCIAGPGELITHDENGLLVNVRNEAEYAIQLRRILMDEALRVRLSTNAVQSMKSFAMENIREQFSNIVFS